MNPSPDWRALQRHNFTDWKKLIDFLEIDEENRLQLLSNPSFPLNLPLRLALKIEKNRLDDPILRQFVPLKIEKQQQEGFVLDPVFDASFRKERKLLHKYQGRALILTTSACAMNCRFCFRQNFDYETENKGFEEELAQIAKDPSLSEIILSGGDPLSLSDLALGNLVKAIDAIPHIQRLRFHTRFPIGIPERITEEFLNILETTRLQTFFAIHCNHARELDPDILFALKRVIKIGAPVLSQTVLLKGVNDSVEALKELCEKLVDHGILPYYLHQLDRVQGAMHFEIAEATGRSLLEQLTTQLSGYAIPKYVREVAGEANKTSL